MKAKFSKKGYLEKFYFKKENIILPWGVETSDSSGFFTLNEKGCRQRIIKKNLGVSEKSIKGFLEVELPHSHWKLEISEQFNQNKIKRKNTLLCLEDSEFNDFVSRFRFKKEFIKSVEIAEKKLFHKNSNIYYQFPVKEVLLNLKNKKRISIKINSYKTIHGLVPIMYARDSGDEWVVHARLFPANPDKKQIKILRDWYNKAIPQGISDVLLSIKPIYNFLWYRGERKGYFPIGAYGLVKAKKGDVLELITEVKVE